MTFDQQQHELFVCASSFTLQAEGPRSRVMLTATLENRQPDSGRFQRFYGDLADLRQFTALFL